MLEAREDEHRDGEPDGPDLAGHVFGAGREPYRKHHEDVAEDALDDKAHEGGAYFGSCYRDRTLAGSTGVEAAVREKDCQKEAARKVGKIYHDPALKKLRRCDLLVQDAEGQQVVAGEEFSAAQDDQHQSQREER